MIADASSAATPSPGAASSPALGVRALFAAAIGVIVGQLGMVAVLQGIGIGGAGFVIAMFAAFMLAIANAMTYAEMALMMPQARSLGSYTEAAIGNFPAILLVFAGYVTPALVGLPAELILAEQIIGNAFSLDLPVGAWSVGLVVLFTALNVLGTDVFARVQTALSFTVLVFIALTGVVALSGNAVASPPGGVVQGLTVLGTDTTTLGVAAIAFWIFVGSEFVTPLVPDARNPQRDLPRAMIGGLLAIFAAQVLFGLGGGVLLSRETLATNGAPHLEYAGAAYGVGAKVWIAGLLLVATASLLNTVIAAVSRMLYGMAEHGQVFSIFKRVHPRLQTPVHAICFVGALPLIGLAWSGADFENFLPLTIAASLSWLLAYGVAQISLMVLRHRHPHAPRPFKVPAYPWTPLLALAGMSYVLFNSSPDPALTPRIIAYVGIVLGVFAVVGGLWVKFVMKKGLFEPTVPASLETKT